MMTAPVAADRLTYSIEEFCEIYGISRSAGYRLARQDRLPVPVIRLGRRYVVSRNAVEEDLARRKGSGSDPVAA